MSHLRLIASAALRERVRWAREHLYLLLVLGPLVLGMTYFGVGRLVREGEWSLTTEWAVAAGALAACALVVLGMSRASAEIYHVRRPESFFESLPVENDTHFYAALVSRAARTLPTVAAAFVARTLAAGGDGAGALADVLLLPALALFVFATATAEVAAALNWIHWGHVRARASAAAALALLLPGVALCGLLLVVIVTPGKLPFAWRGATLACGAAWAALAFALARRWHARWRRSDIEHARRLGTVARRSLFDVRFLRRRLGGGVASQLARDLQLTLRRFSSAVYVVFGVAALLCVALLALLTTGALPEGDPAMAASWLDATWLAPVAAVKATCVLATVALASLTAPLVAHELSRFWVERSVGAAGSEVWRAKLWYARIVSSLAPLAAWAAGALSGEVPAFYLLPLLAESLWLWWLVSTFVGAFAFEIPEQPGLALILMGCVGTAAGLLVAWVWPVGILLLPAIPSLTERGMMRARFYLIEGTD